METYTIKTSTGRTTTMVGTLAEVVAAQKTRRTDTAVYLRSLLICYVCQGEMILAL